MELKKDLKYIIVSAIFLVTSLSFIKNTFIIMENSNRLDALNKEVTQLENDKAYIQEDLAFQKSPGYIEQEARNKLNMIKPKEQTYVVIGSENGDSARTTNVLGENTSSEEPSKDSNIKLWVDLLF